MPGLRVQYHHNYRRDTSFAPVPSLSGFLQLYTIAPKYTSAEPSPFMASAGVELVLGNGFFCYFIGAPHTFLEQAWAEGKGCLQRAATARTADGKNGQKGTPP